MRDEMTEKMLLTAVLAALLLIPLGQIRGTIAERQERQEGVRQDIATTWSRGQTVLTPVVVQPYTVEVRRETGTAPYQSFETVVERRIRLLEGNTGTVYVFPDCRITA